jgi:acetyl esterase/lipase
MAIGVPLAAQGILERTPPPPDERIAYGEDPNQFIEVRHPASARGPAVVFLHGGYWRKAYGLEYGGHLCAALTAEGAETWNVEYRRIGQPGGGWPGTRDDVLAAIRHVRSLRPGRPLVIVGHSEGGHLALLAAEEPGIGRAVAIAPVADLRRAWELKLSRGVVGELLGPEPEPLFAEASPMERAAPRTPIVVIHGEKDDTVPFAMGSAYAAKSRARLIGLPGAGHFDVVNPASSVWPTVAAAILGTAPPR